MGAKTVIATLVFSCIVCSRWIYRCPAIFLFLLRIILMLMLAV